MHFLKLYLLLIMFCNYVWGPSFWEIADRIEERIYPIYQWSPTFFIPRTGSRAFSRVRVGEPFLRHVWGSFFLVGLHTQVSPAPVH